MIWTKTQADSLDLPWQGRDHRGKLVLLDPGTRRRTVTIHHQGDGPVVDYPLDDLAAYLTLYRVAPIKPLDNE
jgi:hypothetical protein